MSWLKDWVHPPVVPDDTVERQRLILNAEARLAEVNGQRSEVVDLTESLRKRNEVNHYIESLRESYRGK